MLQAARLHEILQARRLRYAGDFMPQRLSNVPLSQLVPDINAWKTGAGSDLADWIANVGAIERAIAFGEVYWPDFVEFDDCVLFANFNENNYRAVLAQVDGAKQAAETIMNTRHILEMFPNSSPTHEQSVYFGKLLKEVWSAKLQIQFPNRKVTVTFSEQSRGELVDYTITFFQKRG